MEMQTITTVLVTLITVLGGNTAWKYYEKRLNFKLEHRKLSYKDDLLMSQDFKARIEKLEALLAEAKKEKDDLRDEIVKLTAETSAMKIEVEYLIKENKLLREFIGRGDSPKRKKRKNAPKKA